MNKYLYIVTAAVCLLRSFVGNVFAEEVSQGQVYQLHKCLDKGLEVVFLCDPEWSLEMDKETIFIVMEEEPAVTMTVARQMSSLKTQHQLSNDMLESLGGYEVGYERESVVVDGAEAVKVEGFSKGYPDIRLRDYYLVKDGFVYSILFAVDPASKSFEFSELFDSIMSSFHFTF